MRLFLTILEGRTPSEAEPIFATEDGRVIQLVGSWLAGRLTSQPDPSNTHTEPSASDDTPPAGGVA